MDINEFLRSILYVVITTILPLITTYAIKFVKEKINEKILTIESQYIKETTREAIDIVLEAIEVTNQTYVDELKNNNIFTKEAHEIALQKSINAVLDLMNDDLKEFISDKYNDLELWIQNKIEYLIKEGK